MNQSNPDLVPSPGVQRSKNEPCFGPELRLASISQTYRQISGPGTTMGSFAIRIDYSTDTPTHRWSAKNQQLTLQLRMFVLFCSVFEKKHFISLRAYCLLFSSEWKAKRLCVLMEDGMQQQPEQVTVGPRSSAQTLCCDWTSQSHASFVACLLHN